MYFKNIEEMYMKCRKQLKRAVIYWKKECILCKSCMEENINIVDTWGGVKIRQCFGFFDQSNELNKSKHVLGSSFLFSV